MKNNGTLTLTWRVEQLEKQVDMLDVKLERILTNDLPHIHEKLSSISTRVAVLSLINLSALVLAVIFKYL